MLLGRLADVGVALRDQASLLALTEDVVKTSEIEGEILNVASVRSSIARRLGVDIGAVAPVDRHVEGVVDMLLDATSRAASPLCVERLHGWHAALFPTGFSGMSRIAVAQWRSEADGPTQVVSGPVGRRKVHVEAPPAETLPDQMDRFLAWANGDSGEPARVKADLAQQSVGADPARAEGRLRGAGADPERRARRHPLAGVVPGRAGACRQQRARHPGRGAERGALLAALGGHPAQRMNSCPSVENSGCPSPH